MPRNGTWKIIAPTQAPRNIAGEKTPPKRPKPIHIDVNSNLKNNIKIIKSNTFGVVIMSRTFDIPKPNTSGMKHPTTPHKKPGMRGV